MNNTMINQQNKIAIVIPVYNAEKYTKVYQIFSESNIARF